jgi:hypothetical protein
MGKRELKIFFLNASDIRIGGYLQSVREERPARVVMGISIL